MPRIKGIDIPNNKTLAHSLTYIKGIGLSSAKEIVEETGLDGKMRAKDLSEDDISKIAAILDREYVIEGELTRRVRDNINRLQEIGTYRGTRHKRSLPVRGQRSRHNARTRKGPKKSVAGVSVRKAVSKT